MSAEPTDLSPHVEDISMIDRQIHEPLVGLDENGVLAQVLAAERPEPVDDVTWTVKLREGITFQDGTPLTANIVVGNFDELLARETCQKSINPLRGTLTTTTAVDELTARFKLAQASPRFPALSRQFS